MSTVDGNQRHHSVSQAPDGYLGHRAQAEPRSGVRLGFWTYLPIYVLTFAIGIGLLIWIWMGIIRALEAF